MLLKNNPSIISDISASGGVDLGWKRTTSSYKRILLELNSRKCSALTKKCGSNFVTLC